MGFVAVAKVGDLADGDIVPIKIGDTDIVLYRDGDAYFAAQRECLHQGYDLADGLVDGGFLICPLHGWRYHADSGRHELSPQTCLRTFEVQVMGDDIAIDPTPRWKGELPT